MCGLTSAELPFLDPKLEAWPKGYTHFPTHRLLSAATVPYDRRSALKLPRPDPCSAATLGPAFPPPTVLFPSSSSLPQEIPSELHSGWDERPCPTPAHPPPAAAPPAPRPEATADSGDPRHARPEPHLLLALAAETQARGPLLVPVAVIGASLVRLELHHPPGPGGGAVRVAGVEGGEPAPDGGARARPRLGQGKQGGRAASPLHGSAAGPPRLPHSPLPRPRAAAAVTAAVAAAATAAAPSATATPDDDRAAILGALRQRRKAARACGTAARS